jgi:hypothetical protein
VFDQNAYAMAWRRANPARDMLSRCRTRAERKGIPFEITADDIHIPERCPVLDLLLEVGGGDNAPSLDRIDCTRGYVPGNCLVVSNRANRLKSNSTPDELTKIAKFFGKLL